MHEPHTPNSESSSFRQSGRSPSRYSNKELKATKSTDSKRNRSVSRVRKSIRSLFTKTDGDAVFIFVTIGASTDSAKKKVYPSLWNLFKTGMLPKCIRFYSFARNPMTKDELREKCADYMTVVPEEYTLYEEFWKLNNYYVGSYLARIDYDMLHKDLTNTESSNVMSNRLYYINIPNTFLESVAQNIRTLCQPKTGWNRVITERPFGKDLSTSTKMTQHLLSLCAEEDLFRIDPYLCKEIVQNILTIRFCNLLFSSTWNRKIIENVMITIKESCGTIGIGKYFDSYGIICDVLQVHGLQLLALIAMEKPISMKSDDIRDEKVKLLKCISPVTIENVVLGQYVGNPHALEGDVTKSNYFDDPDVARNSNTPTFCTMVTRVNNERWDGVPFVLKCGKAMDERKTEIRIRYQNVPADIFKTKLQRNELIIQIEPKERVYVKAVTKAGHQQEVQQMEISVNNNDDFTSSWIAEPYNKILLNALEGEQTHFIKTAEIKQAWRIFTPLLNKIEKEGIQPIRYNFGSSGPSEADRLIRKYTEADEVQKSQTK